MTYPVPYHCSPSLPRHLDEDPSFQWGDSLVQALGLILFLVMGTVRIGVQQLNTSVSNQPSCWFPLNLVFWWLCLSPCLVAMSPSLYFTFYFNGSKLLAILSRGTIWQCLEIFLAVILLEGVLLILSR